MNIVEDAQVWPEKISAKELLKHAKEWHQNPAEFDELSHNILSYKTYNLRRVPLDDLGLDNYTVDDDKITDYAERTTEAPPIIVGQWGLIIDGNHRANAAAKRGEEDILAYVYEPQKFG